MDETRRQQEVQEEVVDILEKVSEAVAAATGSKNFNACLEWDASYPVPGLAPTAARAGLTRVLNLTRGLTVSSAQIPDVWHGLADLVHSRPADRALRSAVAIFNDVSFGVNQRHGEVFDVMVRFLFLAAKQCEQRRLPTLRQSYQILLGPPGPDRIGIRESTVYTSTRTQRLAGVRTIARILAQPSSRTVRPGWELSSLARHVANVAPTYASMLTGMYAALPQPDKTLRRLALSAFTINTQDYIQPYEDTDDVESTDNQTLALLNQISEMYV